MAYTGPYATLYHAEGARNGLDGNLVAAVAWRESGHNAAAVGDAGCSCGLMQLNWCGGAGYGYTCQQLQDPATNVYLGARYLGACRSAFPGDWTRTIAAYRQGIQGVIDNGPINEANYIDDILNQWAAYAGTTPPPPSNGTTPTAPLSSTAIVALLAVGALLVSEILR